MCDNQSKIQALVQQRRYFNDFISQIEGQFPTAPLAVLTASLPSLNGTKGNGRGFTQA